MNTCPACGANNKPIAKECAACGAPLQMKKVDFDADQASLDAAIKMPTAPATPGNPAAPTAPKPPSM